MIAWLSEIPSSIVMMATGVLVAVIGAYFSRKKTGAEAAEKITQSAMQILERNDQRMAILENDLGAANFRISKLTQRISSVENDARVYQEALRSLEQQHEALQRKMREWNKGIQILIEQIERHDSSPEWRPKDS